MAQGETEYLVTQAKAGNEEALNQLFEQHRDRLRRLVMLRQDARVRARFDASDVVQEVFVDVAKKLPGYGEKSDIPFYLWLRLIACERLIQLHRMHLGTEKRDPVREVSLQRGSMPEASSFFLASRLAGQFTSVDQDLIRAEIQEKLQHALASMDEHDREVLALRHFEELSTDEIATVLGITRSGVLKRHTRALRRLWKIVNDDSDLQPDS